MRSSVMRAVTLGVTVAALALGASACGGGEEVDKAALAAKLKSDPELKGIPSNVIDGLADCMADVALKYGDKGDLKKYVDGEVKLDDVKGVGPNDKEAEADAEKCAKAAVKQ
jgi:hypothetical protein